MLPMKIKKTQKLEEIIPFFIDEQTEVLQIIDEQDAPVGYLTQEDVLRAIQKGDLTEQISELIQRTNSKNAYKSVERVSGVFNDKERQLYLHVIQTEWFKTLLNSLHDGVYIVDGKGVTVMVNVAYERITDIRAKEVVGRHMTDVIKQGYISQSASMEVLKLKRPVTLMQKIRDERQIIVSSTPIFNRDGEIILVVSSVRDITELLKLKHELEMVHAWRGERAKAINVAEVDVGSLISSEDTNEQFKLADHIAKTDVKVLLQGETGVGKSMLARYIHEKSLRKKERFVALNCSAIPANLIEAELFGYEPGAFTGALRTGKQGLVEQADGGTLFLDEIGDLPLELQVKLLKVVEEQRFSRVGATDERTVDVRIISATHKDLKQHVKEGGFREDLFYRLNVVPIEIPPLRARRREIIPLLDYYLAFFNKKYKREIKMSLECKDWLLEYHWPGNIRELMNLVERLVVTCFDEQIKVDHLPKGYVQSKDGDELFPFEQIMPLKQAVEMVERKMVTAALKKYKTTRKAAEVLGVSQATIVQKLKKWRGTID